MKVIQGARCLFSFVVLAGCGEPSVGGLSPEEARDPGLLLPSPRVATPSAREAFLVPAECTGDCGARTAILPGESVPTAPSVRPLFPWSGATVGRTRPTLRWTLSSSARGARVELCRDRSCTHPTRVVEVPGGEVTLGEALPPGVWFWRLRALGSDGPSVNPGPTWSFRVRARDGETQGAFGLLPDVNGDGFADVVHRWNAVSVHPGSPEGAALRRSVRLTPPGGAAEPSVVVGDIDGDGFGDTAQVGLAPLRVVLHPGGPEGPSDEAAWSVALPADATSVRVLTGLGDVHADGYSDVLVGTTSGAWYVLSGSSDHRPSLRRLAVPETFHGVGAQPSDYDGDGYADVILTGAGLRVYLGAAGGLLFNTEVMDIPCQWSAAGGDADGDGRGDLGCIDPVPGGVRVALFEGRSWGLSRAPTSSRVLSVAMPPAPPRVDASLAQDLDGDGRSELVLGLGWTEPGRVEVHAFPYGATVGALLARIAERPHAMNALVRAVGDTDGDGRDEVLVTTDEDWRTGGVRLFSGSTSGEARRLVSEP